MTAVGDVPPGGWPLLEVRELRKVYGVRTGPLGRAGGEPVVAVDGVSFAVHPGDTLGIVGESGSGKSTVARMILSLTTPTSGTIELLGQPLAGRRGAAMRTYRRSVQMVFQDPYASLSPRRTVGQALTEPLALYHLADGRTARRARVAELLDLVRLPADFARRYPHELSGGQRQRVGIARALAVEPSVIVYDEAVSALDVSVQAQVLNLVKDLQADLGLSSIFISHDLHVVRYVCSRVLVMQNGRVVEEGAVGDVLRHPADPYTQRLVAAVPRIPGHTAFIAR